MIRYMYEFDYNDTPKDNSKAKNALELNIMVHAVADKYACADLKEKAARKFGLAAPLVGDVDACLAAIRFGYASTSALDDALRGIFMDLWILVVGELGREQVDWFLDEVPGLAKQLAMSHTLALAQGKPPRCSCNIKTVALKDLMQHSCIQQSSLRIYTETKIGKFWA